MAIVFVACKLFFYLSEKTTFFFGDQRPTIFFLCFVEEMIFFVVCFPHFAHDMLTFGGFSGQHIFHQF